MRNKLFKTLFLGCLLLSLTGCGFHLRGAESLPPELKTLFLLATPYAPLTLELTQTLRSAGIIIVQDVRGAPITLQIINEQFNQQLLNISANTQVTTYNLQYIVTIQLLNSDGKVIYGPMNVQTNASYAASDTQIMGDNSQLDAQQNLMRQDAVGLIFNRLNSVDVRNAIEKNIK